MTIRTIGQGRKFLSSRQSEGSSVSWNVKGYSYESGRIDIDAELQIRDCSRSIQLEFGICSEKDRTQRLKKLDNLIGELEKMRECLVKAELKGKSEG